MPRSARPLSVAELAAFLGAQFTGDGSAQITGAGSLEAAEQGELSYVDGPRNFASARASRCSVLIAPTGYDDQSKSVIRLDASRLGFARAIGLLFPDQPIATGIHATALIAQSARLGARVAVGPYSVIGENCVLGDDTQIGELVTVARDVSIGAGCLLHAGVRVYEGVQIGARCILHSGAVVGSDGLGFVMTESGYEKYPQRGAVKVGDDVEIGANTTIDRGSIENTVIGRGTKLDNLVHIAHNCRIGEHCVIAAQTGVAGSTVIGNRVSIGGQVGVADHCTIEDGAVVGAQAGIPTGKRIAGKTMVWGTPARPMSEFRDQYRDLLSIRQLRESLRDMKGRIEAIEQALKDKTGRS